MFMSCNPPQVVPLGTVAQVLALVSIINYSLHVNSREIDQQKQNKTVAR